eukprot:TRINITY_DN19529_c0_g1_i1.p1 TRINITY_DN19529_c0_g1~~TRINITY_DN19529_c0_g1_i1.p1  ORF type:complete len:455 (+),score=116.28 TRINITY_DN19529_c0_g1_i1:154-1518(+)
MRDPFMKINVFDTAGKLDDINMLLVAHLPRHRSTALPREDALELSNRVSRYGRVIGVLILSNITAKFRPLQTVAGLQRLVVREVLTPREVEQLKLFEPNDWVYVICTWSLTAVQEACREDGNVGSHYMEANRIPTRGVLSGIPDGFHREMLQCYKKLRSTVGTLEDHKLRMPLAYPNFVQVMVDCLLLTTPAAMTAQFGNSWALLAAAQMTLFYAGLLELSKVFLDPFDNEVADDQSLAPFQVSCILSETHFAADRWKAAVSEPLPWVDSAFVDDTPDIEHFRKKQRLLALMRRLPLLAPAVEAADAEELLILMDGIEELKLPRGEAVMRQGEASTSMYVIIKGYCSVDVDGHEIGTLGPGQTFGDCALIENAPRKTTVTVRTSKAVLLSVSKKAFLDKIHPQSEKGGESAEKGLLQDLPKKRMEGFLGFVTGDKPAKGSKKKSASPTSNEATG